MFSKARLVFTSLAVLIGLLCIVSVASAAMFIINTNDASVAEWTTQSIPVFQTDPVDGGVTASMDLLDAWVARSITNTNAASQTLNFRATFNSSTPLSTAATAVIAVLDCDGDNVIGNDAADRAIVYIRTGNMALADDAIYVIYGDYSNNYWFAGSENPEVLNPPFGEPVGNSIEWAVPLAELDATDPNYCQSPIGIRFATANVSVNIFSGQISVTYVDQNSAFNRYNVPTAVRLETLEARAQPTSVATFGIVLGLAVALGVVIVARSRRQ